MNVQVIGLSMNPHILKANPTEFIIRKLEAIRATRVIHHPKPI